MADPEAGCQTDVDGCVVQTAPLAGILKDFVTGWRETRRSTKGGGYRPPDPDAVEPMGPYEWLAFDSGLPENEIRRVRRPERYPLTELRIADALVASIGCDPMIFGCDALGIEPVLKIEPNPAAPAERRAECCGGSSSLTGSL